MARVLQFSSVLLAILLGGFRASELYLAISILSTLAIRKGGLYNVTCNFASCLIKWSGPI